MFGNEKIIIFGNLILVLFNNIIHKLHHHATAGTNQVIVMLTLIQLKHGLSTFKMMPCH